MKQFEAPDIIFDFFCVDDTLSASIDPMDDTGGGEITTPEDDLLSEPVEK